ncbi:ArnT family glycosyltransferase [Phycisphaerales bacterium AB-hyl4]|uniref:ArnT family glycosyltransferase n=1 Tax=Natronomicrosphaera hydrolytica TaxID=3242702 RepID=A0ABV4U920_9BACT
MLNNVRPLTRRELTLLLLIVFAGVGLRAVHMPQTRLWVDEAESAINALTILEHGYPVDTYQGLPKYENVLIRPWEDHPEYEFRDVSYSSRGVPVYHAWLPMYAMAGSMKAMGVRPDPVHETPRVLHSADDMRLRTVAARLPGLVFSAVFLFCMFQLGRRMGGEAAGWAALVICAFAATNVYLGVQARYYSATLAFTAMSLLCLWLVLHRGRWRDFALAGLALSLLFHTHILSAFIAAVMFAVTSPWMLRHERVLAKLVLCGGMLTVAALPWIVLTDFLGTATGLPRARELMDLPRDLFAFPLDRPLVFSVLMFGLLAAVASWLLRHRLPLRFLEPFHRSMPAYMLLAVWSVTAYLAFTLLIPAASYFTQRLSLMLQVPVFLLMAMVFVHMAAMIVPRYAGLLACAGLLLLLATTDRLALPHEAWGKNSGPMAALVNRLSLETFEPGTRIYSTPNSHFVVAYYTGLPVQSVAPVRRSFLNEYDGPIVLVEFTDVPPRPRERVLERDAESAGRSLSSDEIDQAIRQIQIHLMRDQWASRVGELGPQLDPPPEWLNASVEDVRRRWDLNIRRDTRRYSHVLVFRGYTVRHYPDWWQTFFYRFVEPEQRMGENVNYAERIRHGRSIMMPHVGCVLHLADQPVPEARLAADDVNDE